MSRSLIPNSTQIPDVILDEWLAMLEGAEFKLVMFIARKTFGWGKSFDRISLTQIQEGTGMARSTVVAACTSLTERGILETRPANGRTPAAYRLNLAAETGIEHTPQHPQNDADYTDFDTSDCTDNPTSSKIELVGLSARTVPIIEPTRNKETKEKTPLCLKKDIGPPQGGRDAQKAKSGFVENSVPSQKSEHLKSESPPKQPRARFTPPTLDEVRQCFAGHGRSDLADEWFGYWDSVDWWRKRGVRMQKWRSAAAGWVATKALDPKMQVPSRASPSSPKSAVQVAAMFEGQIARLRETG